MPRSVHIVTAAIAAALLSAGPADAIIGAAADGADHPYVGGVDARPAGGPISTASGVLISPTVLLTAGHGTRRIEQAGLHTARVTFDPVASDASTWYTGTVHTNPAYDPQSADDPGDLGVVVFDTPIPGVTPAALPAAGTLSHWSAGAMDVVAYGISDGGGGRARPDPSTTGVRRAALQSFSSLSPGFLRLRMADGAAICTGDSGSPSLVGDTIIGITVTEPSLSGGRCVAQPWDSRVDTPSARAFIGQYVALP